MSASELFWIVALAVVLGPIIIWMGIMIVFGGAALIVGYTLEAYRWADRKILEWAARRLRE